MGVFLSMNIEDIKFFLVQADKKNKLATSYLIYGGTESERENIGFFFSMLIHCKKLEKPCGKCMFCKQVKNNIHPDVRWVILTKKFLSINDVREVKREIYLKPYSGNRKIYFFNVDYMKEEAANSFLKILEEPPLYGILVILSFNINHFLPTVISRCQRLKLNFNFPEFDDELKESQGEFLKCISHLEDKKFDMFFKTIEDMTKNMEREEIEKWLEHVMWMYRDVFLKKNKFPAEMLVNKNIANYGGRSSAVDNIEKILELRGRIKFNINVRIALENLLFQLGELPHST